MKSDALRNCLALSWFAVFFGLVITHSTSLSADKTITVHILYTSDSKGYFEPCG